MPRTALRKPDPEQDRILREPISGRLIVEAGPGYGKTDVACARVASFLKDGVGEGEVVLLTFTRTAVREIRDRVAALSKLGLDPGSIEIRTLDSFAWRLRRGILEPNARVSGSAYEDTFNKLIRTLRDPNRGNDQVRLLEYLGRKRHIIVDEAQDLVASRAAFVDLLLQAVHQESGWTVFVDPAQAIYDWVESDDGVVGEESFLTSLPRLSTSAKTIRLKTQHRTSDRGLRHLHQQAREIVLQAEGDTACEQLRDLLIDVEGADRVETKSILQFAAAPLNNSSRFILYKRRGDALMLSGSLSGAGCRHQLRIGHMAAVSPAWIAAVSPSLDPDRWTEAAFGDVWHDSAKRHPHHFRDWTVESAWRSLRGIASEGRTAVSVARISDAIASGYLPDELIRREIGFSGPMVGTIHASKGREADEVLLVVPGRNGNDVETREDARVIYVGLTRPRSKLRVADGTGRGIFSYQKEDRVWRRVARSGNIQIEVGREGDVHPAGSILAVPDPHSVQEFLLRFDGHPVPVRAQKTMNDAEFKDRRTKQFRLDLYLADEPAIQLGSLSADFDREVFEACFPSWGRGASSMKYAYLLDVRSTSLPEGDPALSRMPEPWRTRRLWLTPVVAGLFVAFKPKPKPNKVSR